MIWGGADAIIIEIKCTINVVQLNHPQTITLPTAWVCGKTCLPQNLVPKRLGTSGIEGFPKFLVSLSLFWKKKKVTQEIQTNKSALVKKGKYTAKNPLHLASTIPIPLTTELQRLLGVYFINHLPRRLYEPINWQSMWNLDIFLPAIQHLG